MSYFTRFHLLQQGQRDFNTKKGLLASSVYNSGARFSEESHLSRWMMLWRLVLSACSGHTEPQRHSLHKDTLILQWIELLSCFSYHNVTRLNSVHIYIYSYTSAQKFEVLLLIRAAFIWSKIEKMLKYYYNLLCFYFFMWIYVRM